MNAPLSKPVSAFRVIAHWDAEADVFHSQSDIPGLVVEAASFEEFVAVVRELAPMLIAENLPGVKGPHRIQIEGRRDVLLAS